jgi:transposase
LGVIRLENKYSAERLNMACSRAIEYKAYSYQNVANILEKGLDKQAENSKSHSVIIDHENIRGADYYLENMEDLKNAYTNYN